jgi:hypothetical protein
VTHASAAAISGKIYCACQAPKVRPFRSVTFPFRGRGGLRPRAVPTGCTPSPPRARGPRNRPRQGGWGRAARDRRIPSAAQRPDPANGAVRPRVVGSLSISWPSDTDPIPAAAASYICTRTRYRPTGVCRERESKAISAQRQPQRSRRQRREGVRRDGRRGQKGRGGSGQGEASEQGKAREGARVSCSCVVRWGST